MTFRLRLVSAQPASQPGQMSRPNAFDAPSRDAALRFWSGLMMRRCGDYRAVARQFDVTEQTGRNWIDGHAMPTGLAVMRAVEWWPEDFGLAQLARAA